jgi:ABC-type transporter Mla subunit MlaD
MEAKTNDFKLGVFALVSLGLLGAGLFAFGAVSYFQKMDVLETYLNGNADGLSVGAPVTLRGVKVGKVTRMDFSWNVYDQTGPQYVIVEFEARNNLSPGASRKALAERVQAQVKRGLRARIKPQGFTGSSLLSLEYVDPAEYPPPPFPWKPRYLCIPSAPGQFGEILDSAQKTLHNIGELDLKGLGGSLQRDLAAAEKLIDRLERDLGGAEKLIGHLDEVNYHGIATNADALITELRRDVKEMHLAKLSNDADEALTGVKATLDRLDLVVGNLDTGSLNDAFANMRLASKDLDDTLVKLQKYPAGFLLGRPPPPARSVEKARE